MSQIKAIVEIINSKRDRAGNCYWAFVYMDTATGKTARGKISGGDSNIRAALWHMHGDGTNYRAISREVGVRPFDSEMAKWPYAGCPPVEIATFIKSELAKP